MVVRIGLLKRLMYVVLLMLVIISTTMISMSFFPSSKDGKSKAAHFSAITAKHNSSSSSAFRRTKKEMPISLPTFPKKTVECSAASYGVVSILENKAPGKCDPKCVFLISLQGTIDSSKPWCWIQSTNSSSMTSGTWQQAVESNIGTHERKLQALETENQELLRKFHNAQTTLRELDKDFRDIAPELLQCAREANLKKRLKIIEYQDEIIKFFLSSLPGKPWDRSPPPRIFQEQKAPLKAALETFEKTLECGVVHDYLSNHDYNYGTNRDIHVVLVPRGQIDNDLVPEKMTVEELMSALNLVEDTEFYTTQHRRRTDLIAQFDIPHFEQLAWHLGCEDAKIQTCFAQQMMLRKLDGQRDSLRVYRHCSSKCTGSVDCILSEQDPQVYRSNISDDLNIAGTQCVNMLQRFVDWLDDIQYSNFQWSSHKQLVSLFKKRLLQREKDLELAIRWNLCHPAVSSLSVLVPSSKKFRFPAALARISDRRFHLKKQKTWGSVSFSDAINDIVQQSKAKFAIVARWDVILGQGFHDLISQLSPGVSWAITGHQAFKYGGVSPVEFCADGIGGDHVAFVLSLPVPSLLQNYSTISVDMEYGETGFVDALCRCSLTVENPCMERKVFHISRVEGLRLQRDFGINSKRFMGTAKTCKPGDVGSHCCSRGNLGSVSTPTTWKAVEENPVWKYQSGKDEPFDSFALGFSEPDMMPFTQAVQTFLYKWQHPQNCSTSRYRSLGGPISGIGSILHSMTIAMARAIEEGSIFYADVKFLWAERGNTFCSTDKTINCFLLPLTHCNPREHNIPVHGAFGDRISDWIYLTDPRLHVGPPKVLVDWLKQHNIAVPSYYWWRAQALTYLLRFNSATRTELLKMRKLAWEDGVVVTPETTSTHVRHGDKGIEMRLVPFSDYLLAVNTYLDSNKIFLSTEDHGVIEEGSRLPKPWDITWVHQDRQNLGFNQLVDRGDQEFLSSMLNLMIALECDNWIGTLASNWNRMIDELRCTISGKARSVHIEVGDHSFGN